MPVAWASNAHSQLQASYTKKEWHRNPAGLLFTTGALYLTAAYYFIFDAMDTSTRPPVKHLGKKIGRIREMLGMKQETLAEKMGISQQSVSKLEQSETLEEATLERVAKALGVKKEAIENFNDEALIFHIENMHDQSSAYNQNYNHQCTFNPLDKYIEAIEENKKLYEALLKAEREKIALLEKLLEKK